MATMAELTADELEAAVIAGNKSIKPADIEKARAAERFAALQAQSDAREAAEREARERKEAQEAFKAGDYEEFMTTDLEPLREAYAALVVAVADLYTLTQEHRRKQIQIMKTAMKLGLHNHPITSAVMPHRAPVREDAERWAAQFVGVDYIESAVMEGKRGFPNASGKAGSHVLHTPERREELRSLNEPGVNKKQAGIEMRDRILNEALSGE